MDGLLKSLDLTPIDFFLWGHLNEHIYTVPPSTIEDLMVRLQVAVKVVNANKLRHVQEKAMWHTAISLKMDGGCFEYLM
jgi:hypothetical protein